MSFWQEVGRLQGRQWLQSVPRARSSSSSTPRRRFRVNATERSFSYPCGWTRGPHLCFLNSLCPSPFSREGRVSTRISLRCLFGAKCLYRIFLLIVFPTVIKFLVTQMQELSIYKGCRRLSRDYRLLRSGSAVFPTQKTTSGDYFWRLPKNEF